MVDWRDLKRNDDIDDPEGQLFGLLEALAHPLGKTLIGLLLAVGLGYGVLQLIAAGSGTRPESMPPGSEPDRLGPNHAAAVQERCRDAAEMEIGAGVEHPDDESPKAIVQCRGNHCKMLSHVVHDSGNHVEYVCQVERTSMRWRLLRFERRR